MNESDWITEDEEKELPPLIAWLKRNWETILTIFLVVSLVIITLCSFLQLVFLIKIYYK